MLAGRPQEGMKMSDTVFWGLWDKATHIKNLIDALRDEMEGLVNSLEGGAAVDGSQGTARPTPKESTAAGIRIHQPDDEAFQ